MKNNRKRRYKSAITRKIFLQYFLVLLLSVAVYVIVCLLLYFAAVTIYYSFDLNEEVFYYQLAHRILAIPQWVFLIPVLLIWAAITCIFMSRPLRYLDEVVDASARLAARDRDPIILSDELKQVQDDLNSIRETSLQNEEISREAEQRKNDLVVYLAHDLKTPLASVIGYLNLLLDEPQISDEMRKKYLSITLDKAERLEDLINEFFEIARFNLSDIPLQYSRVNLTRLLEQLVFEFKPMLDDKHLNCKLEMAPDIMLRCDADKLERAFDNLLRNAVIYSYENTDITVTAVQQEQRIVLHFANCGDTIPREKLERIFEQFYRVDEARSTSLGGAGLGLAIAKQIIEKHHGTITAQSAEDRIEFEVTLPLV